MGSGVGMSWGCLRGNEGMRGFLNALAWLDVLIGVVVVVTRVV